MSFAEAVRIEDGVEYVGEFETGPIYPATREEPADGGAVCTGLYVYMIGGSGDEGEYVKLDPGKFNSMIESMTQEIESEI